MEIDRSIDIGGFAKVNERIWCISYRYNYLFSFDYRTRQLDKAIRIPYGKAYTRCSIKFIVGYGEYLILPVDKLDRVYRFDTQSEEFECLSDTFLRRFGCVSDVVSDEIYGVTGNDNFVYKYNLKTFQYEKWEVGNASEQHTLVQCKDNYLIIAGLESEEVIVWDIDKKKIGKKIHYPEDYSVKHYPLYSFGSISIIDNNILMLPQYANMILNIDLEKARAISYELDYEPYSYDKGMIYTTSRVIDGKIWTYSEWKGEWGIIDFYSDEVEHFKTDLDEKQLEEFDRESLFTNNQYGEEGIETVYVETEFYKHYINLRKLINDIQKAHTIRNTGFEEKIGERIYRKLI